MENNGAQDIKFGSIGAIYENDRHSHGYYMIEFTSFNLSLSKTKPYIGKSLRLVN